MIPYYGQTSSRVKMLEQQLSILGYTKALKAMDLIIHEMCAEKDFKRHDGAHYYYHLVDVTQILLSFGVKNEDVLTAALLHDLLEDVTWANREYVDETFGVRVGEIVSRVTKKKDVDYKADTAEMDRYLNHIGEMWESALVKTADRIHNFSSMRSSSRKHKQKQVVETETFYIPFFKTCRNQYPRYAPFFFFAKTMIEPTLFEIKESLRLGDKLECLLNIRT